MNKSNPLHWIITIALAFITAGVWSIFSDIQWAAYGSLALLILSIGNLIWRTRKSINARSAAFGLNSGITILLVLALVGVVNFLLQKHVWKWDLSRAKLNTLSDQTQKVVKNLKVPVKGVFFAKTQQEEKMKYSPLFEDYRALNSKFEIEYVDPDKDTVRAANSGIKTYQTLLLKVGSREMKIEEPTEEKLTNALIKLSKEKSETICYPTSHGEKSFVNVEATGLEAMRKTLENQSYTFQEVDLRSETKLSEKCSVISILGPVSAYFPNEIKALKDYLNAGGRAFIALDLGLKSNPELVPELSDLLKEWGVRLAPALILDPLSRMNQLEATVPATSSFSKESSITRELQGVAVLPLSRPVEILKNAPTELKIQWLVQTTPGSWGEANLDSLKKGGAVNFDEGTDIRGPMNALVSIEGKKNGTNASRNTRIVVAGTSLFGTNQWSRFGINRDLFANSVSWLVDDESLISIRNREDENSLIQLTQLQGGIIFYVTVLLIPFGIAVSGIIVWWRRKKL